MNENIQYGDVVKHRGGGIHRVSEVTGDVLHITREGVGGVFRGTASQAREQGFAFGDEQFHSNGRPISDWDIPTAIDAAERAYIGVLPDSDHRSVFQFAISAGTAVRQAQLTITDARSKQRAAEYALTKFKEDVREAIVEAQKEHDLCRAGTNEVLEALGLTPITPTWTVTVTDSNTGVTILTVTGVEADSESDACDVVRDDFEVSARVLKVRYTYDYSGVGEASLKVPSQTDSDVSEDDGDDYATYHKDDVLVFAAEEE